MQYASRKLGLGLLAAGAVTAAAHAQCSVSATYSHSFAIEFSQPVQCLFSSSFVGAAGVVLTFPSNPQPGCGALCFLPPCTPFVVDANFDYMSSFGCGSSASAGSCNGAAAQASTSSMGLEGTVSGTTIINTHCGFMSIPLYTIADPYLLIDPASMAGVTYSISLGSLGDPDLGGDQHGVAVVFDGTVVYVVYTLSGVRTSPGVTFDTMTGEWVAQVTNVPLPGSGELQPFFVTFDKQTFDIDDDGAFTQDDIDDIALLIGTPVGASDPLGVYDLDGDGGIDADDIDILQALFDAGMGSCVGDANGDQAVDVNDMNLVLAYFGSEVEDADSVGADVNDDGSVDVQDLNIVLAAFGNPCP